MTTDKRLAGRGGDLLVHIESPEYNLISGQLTAPGSGGPFNFYQDNPVGYPLLANNVLAIGNSDEASVVALVVFGKPLDDLANSADTANVVPYTIINKFYGAVINENAIATTDAAASTTAFTLATIKTALEALGAKFVAEPTKTQTQTN